MIIKIFVLIIVIWVLFILLIYIPTLIIFGIINIITNGKINYIVKMWLDVGDILLLQFVNKKYNKK